MSKVHELPDIERLREVPSLRHGFTGQRLWSGLVQLQDVDTSEALHAAFETAG